MSQIVHRVTMQYYCGGLSLLFSSLFVLPRANTFSLIKPFTMGVHYHRDPYRVFSSSSSFTVTAINNTISSLSSSSIKSFYGGDFAGHSATFSSKTGELIRVPEHLVPASLVEWDRIPSCFEVITSEDIEDSILYRNIITVLPEVGCGVDNLDTTKTREDFNISNIHGFFHSDHCRVTTVSRSITSSNNNQNKNIQNMETTFIPRYTHPSSSSSSSSSKMEDNPSLPWKRIRVSFDIDIHHFSFTSPIRMVVERQTSATSTKGKIAHGGGLDGRTVANLIGVDISNKPFSDGSALSLDMLEKYLTKTHNDMNKNVLLSLPGNIILQYGIHDADFIIHVIHLLEKEDSLEPIQIQYRISRSSNNKHSIITTLLS